MANVAQLGWKALPTPQTGPTGAANTLVVLDFDCTLAATHMYMLLRSPNGQQAASRDPDGFYLQVFGGSARLDALRSFLAEMRTAGATLCVLSNGFESEIKPALHSTRLIDLFDRVIGAETLDAVSSPDKPWMLARLALDASGKCSHLVFVDDDRQNFPGLAGGREARPRDAWQLSGNGAPNATLVAWPAGEGEGGSGLDVGAMRGIASLVVGP